MAGITLHNANCIDIMRDMPNECVDLVLTDPPYKTISGGKKSALGFGWRTSVLKENDGKIFKHNDIKFSEYLPELYRVLKPGRDCYIMTNNLNFKDALIEAEKAGFKFHNLLLWIKNTATANRWYMKNVEYTLYLYKPPARRINNAGTKQTHYADNPRNKLHPTEKPISLFYEYINNSSEEGWLVFDPFMGAGTAGVAATILKRDFIGIELDEEYYNIAKKRIEKC